MKIYKLIFHSLEEEKFILSATFSEHLLFSDLHKGIQKALLFDPMQMASFFLHHPTEEEIEIALFDMGNNDKSLLMDEERVGDHIDYKGQRLIYLFDFFSERSLIAEVEAIENQDKEIFNIDVKGPIPQQILIDSENIEHLMDGYQEDAYDDDFKDEFDNDFDQDEFGNDEFNFDEMSESENY
ncbi:MAG: hypothetical protein JXR60_11245 [Bacteroidales bacterium]|nr:hypothetical protein [Bacteroidales bacterium]